MGFGDKFKKVFNIKKDVKSQKNEKESFAKEFSKKSIKKVPNSIKSFKYLDDLICCRENEIILDCDIVFDSSIDCDYQKGIKIKDKDMSIDGNGHEIDGKAAARIFDICGGSLTVKNAVLKNGFDVRGSAVCGKYCEILFDNVVFRDNLGCAVEGEESRFTFDKCHFENNLKSAISSNLGKIKICGSEFIGNGSRAIHIWGDNLKLENLSYVKVKDDAELICTDSLFENNSGGAIICKGNLKLNKVTFKNNGADNGSAIMSQSSPFQNHEKTVVGCEFDQNSILADSIDIYDSKFTNCPIEMVCIEESSKIRGSIFFKNAVAIENRGYLNIENATFSSNEKAIINDELNKANYDYDSNNQYLFNSNSYISITDSDFTDNGRDILNEGVISINGSTFRNCLNTKSLICQNGDDSHIEIAGCEFIANSENLAIISSGTGDIFNSKFELGAGKFAMFNQADLTVNNLTFKSSASDETFIFNDNIIKSKDRQIERFVRNGPNGIFRHINPSLPIGWKGFDYLNNLIIESNGEVVLDCDILMHDAEYEFYAGGIEISRDNLLIDGQNHTIDANHLSKIFHITGNNIVLKNIRFVNGMEFNDPLFNKGGGALYTVFNSSVKLYGCEFSDNKSQSSAGAVKSNGDIYIENSLFNENEAVSGGAFVSSKGISEIYCCMFESNIAEYNAGAIQIDLNAKLSIEESVFKSNSAQNSGGALLNLGILDIMTTQFLENKSSQSGGAIHTQEETRLKISKSKFIKNNALLGGGINTTKYSDFSIYESCFDGNSAMFGGGAIYDSTSDSAISGCSFLTDKDTIKSYYDDDDY